MKRKIKSTSEGVAKLSLVQPTKQVLEEEEHPKCDSDNHAFVGVVRGIAIYPLFIEASYGDVYNHV